MITNAGLGLPQRQKSDLSHQKFITLDTWPFSWSVTKFKQKLTISDRIDRQNMGLLVSRMVQGDRAAFCCIYRFYYNHLLRYGLIIVSNQNVVEDRIQDLFVWVLEHPREVKEVKNFEIYLFQSLKRNLRQHVKKEIRSRDILQNYTHTNRSPVHPSVETRSIEREDLAFTTAWVHQKLESLPARQKEIIFLRYYRGMSYDEISSITSVSNQVARNLVFRGLKHIRKLGNVEKFLPSLFFFCTL